jgi:hypothetical protein
MYGFMTILQAECYNALYENGVLLHQGKPDYLNAHTLANVFPDAELYYVEDDIYESMYDGYPENLSEFPLDHCRRYR